MADERTLLVVHHTPSPHCQAMFEAVISGATAPEIEGVEVVRRAALSVSASDFLDADGYVLGSPVNLGYISGALKHAFDVSYYQILDSTIGRPFALYLHGNEGSEGALRAVDSITTGLRWSKAAEHVIASNKPTKDDLDRCWELGATVAAQLMA
jgi:multimeric flavodoxin WrbA